ncbi:AMP-binding protein [Gulosibacter sp. 10]|uniref:AMP-binding protein n=1 Tax=Gulosibacter sp. 10 TaxID=1255570 RepID=UPI00097EC79A|nr:AMP-binding protein [Gulosibacter sp. 10]SJM55921.1 O-succinylbenzoic acid--CoA ligase [Gulosibacter sp. 10]
MPRELRIVSAADPLAVMRALDDAMSGAGPAVMPVPAEGSAALEPPAGIPDGAPADVAAVVETSGSTARPKRVMLTARALHASGAATYERLDALAAGRGIRAGSPYPTRQWLLCLPANYVAGLQVLARSLQAGTRPVVAEGGFDPLEFEALAARMDAERRYVSLVPAQLIRLVEAVSGEDRSWAERERISARLGRFDGILVGGQSTPRHILERARSFGWAVTTTYGASETSGGCVYNGVPLHGVRARVEAGELWLSGPVLAAGYLGEEARTAETFVEADGRRWYRTSDGGAVTETAESLGAQRIAVTGRLDHVLISGGEKVDLDEVERGVRRLSGFEEAVAVAVPSAEWGESVAIVCAGEGPGDEAADLAALRDAVVRLGRAARPVRRLRVAELPMLPSGKPDRRRIRELAAEAAGRPDGAS